MRGKSRSSSDNDLDNYPLYVPLPSISNGFSHSYYNVSIQSVVDHWQTSEMFPSCSQLQLGSPT